MISNQEASSIAINLASKSEVLYTETLGEDQLFDRVTLSLRHMDVYSGYLYITRWYVGNFYREDQFVTVNQAIDSINNYLNSGQPLGFVKEIPTV